jgi:hypothetical protein
LGERRVRNAKAGGSIPPGSTTPPPPTPKIHDAGSGKNFSISQPASFGWQLDAKFCLSTRATELIFRTPLALSQREYGDDDHMPVPRLLHHAGENLAAGDAAGVDRDAGSVFELSTIVGLYDDYPEVSFVANNEAPATPT